MIRAEHAVGVGESGVGGCEFRIELDGALEILARLVHCGRQPQPPEVAAAQVELIGIHVGGATLHPCLLGTAHELHLEHLDDRRGDLVLDGEYVFHLAVVALRPQVVAVGDVDQLGGDAQPVAGAPHAALQHRGYVERRADLADVLAFAFE